MAAYDEVMYQQGEDPPPHPLMPDQVVVRAILDQAFAEGASYERARITELLCSNGQLMQVTLIHGEGWNRVSLFKWGNGTGLQTRCMELRAEARETLRDVREGWGYAPE